MEMPEPAKRSLDDWVALIRDREMPIFGRTARAIGVVTDSESASASALAQIILQDVGMTARVLRLANSAYFNSSGQSISTISRAIVVMGFDLVRDMALSVALVDTLLKGGVKQRVVAEMARSFHAAVQARSAALQRRDAAPEEVFIAALLYRLGDMAFWCSAGEVGGTLDAALREPGAVAEAVQERVLGFRLQQLTAELAREWLLPAMLQAVTQEGAGRESRERGVVLGHALAAAVEYGWDSARARAAIEDLAEFVARPVEEVAAAVRRSAAEAARVASAFGAADAARLIPAPPRTQERPPEASAEQPAQPEVVWVPGPDPMLQLRILREFSALIASGPQPNDLMQMALEGIYRGIPVERALFALLSADRRQLTAKIALGTGGEGLAARFRFAHEPGQRDQLWEVVEKQRAFFSPAADGPASARLRSLAGNASFMIAPIVATGRTVGCFYAERGTGAAPLDQDDYLAFQHFAQQAGFGLEHLSLRSPRPV
jgi:HD-like signal output (HDOD) protein